MFVGGCCSPRTFRWVRMLEPNGATQPRSHSTERCTLSTAAPLIVLAAVRCTHAGSRVRQSERQQLSMFPPFFLASVLLLFLFFVRIYGTSPKLLSFASAILCRIARPSRGCAVCLRVEEQMNYTVSDISASNYIAFRLESEVIESVQQLPTILTRPSGMTWLCWRPWKPCSSSCSKACCNPSENLPPSVRNFPRLICCYCADNSWKLGGGGHSCLFIIIYYTLNKRIKLLFLFFRV